MFLQKKEKGVIISASLRQEQKMLQKTKNGREKIENKIEREVSFLEEYTKTVFYTYPLLATVEKDYQEHILNKAILSYDVSINAERLAEYLASEVIEKEKLRWLKSVVETVLGKLSEEERTLMEIRYFGRTKKIRTLVKSKKEMGQAIQPENGLWSERTYFRKQTRLYEKAKTLLMAAGLTKEVYDSEFSDLDIFKKVDTYIQKGGLEKKVCNERKEWNGSYSSDS